MSSFRPEIETPPPVFVPLIELENLAPRTHYVNALAVFPQFQGRGLGRLLLRAAAVSSFASVFISIRSLKVSFTVAAILQAGPQVRSWAAWPVPIPRSRPVAVWDSLSIQPMG